MESYVSTTWAATQSTPSRSKLHRNRSIYPETYFPYVSTRDNLAETMRRFSARGGPAERVERKKKKEKERERSPVEKWNEAWTPERAQVFPANWSIKYLNRSTFSATWGIRTYQGARERERERERVREWDYESSLTTCVARVRVRGRKAARTWLAARGI